MVQWVYERATQAKLVDRVVVATEDDRIAQAVRAFGGEVILTSAEIQSGTDRVAAVARELQADFYVNVQGDEPLMSPQAIDAAVGLVTSGRFKMGTVMTSFASIQDVSVPHNVKVIADRQGRAIYFSRLPIPYGREPIPTELSQLACRRHVGLYSFARETLLEMTALPLGEWEQAEMLEQLRALQSGIAIGIEQIEFRSMEVNTPEDLQRIEQVFTPKDFGVSHG